MKQMATIISEIKNFILDLIFPIECLGCDREGEWLCNECLEKVYIKDDLVCFHCRLPNGTGKFCDRCRDGYFLDRILVATSYEQKIIEEMIKVLKYRFVANVSDYLGLILGRFLKKHNLDFRNFLIVPVPLHPRRERARGFNQAELLAQIVAREFNLEIDIKNLKRIKYSGEQARLKKEDRLTNVKNCFAWQGGDLRGRKVVLIDDVVTTGATMNECARILKEAGAGRVWGLVVARN